MLLVRNKISSPFVDAAQMTAALPGSNGAPGILGTVARHFIPTNNRVADEKMTFTDKRVAGCNQLYRNSDQGHSTH